MKEVLEIVLLTTVLVFGYMFLFFPEFAGEWLREVDNARYENVVDQ